MSGWGVNGLHDTGLGGVWATKYLRSGMRVLSLAVPVMWSVTRAAASHQDSHDHVSKPDTCLYLSWPNRFFCDCLLNYIFLKRF